MKNRQAIFLPLLVLSAFAVSLPNPSIATVADGGFSDFPSDLKTEYSVGDEFTFPEMSYPGAESFGMSLIFPDGTAKYGSKITLSEAGYYTIRCAAKKDGVPYEKTQRIKVNNKLFTFGNEESHAEYGAVTGHGEEEQAKLSSGRYPNQGLWVHLHKGDTMTFGAPIPVSKFDGSSFIQGFATPATQGTADLDALDVVLTDSLDPSITVTFNLLRHTENARYRATTSVKVAGNGQPLTGYEAGKNQYLVNGAWGTNIGHSFSGVINTKEDGTEWYEGLNKNVPYNRSQFVLGYDDETKQCFAGTNNSNSFTTQTLNYCADLDSLDCFTDVWRGFPSGRVYLSIHGENFIGQEAGFMLTYLRDFPNLQENKLDDNSAPEISLDSSIDPLNMPEAYTGKYYTIPEVSASDDFVSSPLLSTEVDFNYLSGSPISIPHDDASFYVPYAGMYRIVYKARDYYENESSLVLYVHAGGDIDPLTATLPSEDVEVPLGSYYEFPELAISGGSGSKSVELYVDGTLTEEKGMVFEKAGDVKLLYVVRDFAGGETTAEMTLHCVASNVPVIAEKPSFPAYLLSSATYSLPLVNAKDYSSGSKVEAPCDVTISYNGQIQEKKAGESFVAPEVANNGDKISIVYHSGSTSLPAIEIPTLSVASGERLRLASYFVGAKDMTLTKDGASFVASEGAEDMGFTFANALYQSAGSLSLASIPGHSMMDSLSFKLTDRDDPSVSVTAKLTFQDQTIDIAIGDMSYSVSGTMNGATAFLFTLGYANGNILYTGSSASRLPIFVDDAGNAFSGFPSGYVYLSVEAKGVFKGDGFVVAKIGDDPISSYTLSDTFSPRVYSESSLGGMLPQGSEYKICKSFASDVLSPSSRVGMTVLDPDGEVATSVDGTKLENVDPSEKEYTLRLDKLGDYAIKLSAEESDWKWSNPSSSQYTVTSVDAEAPYAALSHEMKSTVAVGDVIYVPPLIVHDNATPADSLKVTVTVTLPNGRHMGLKQDQGIRATLSGKYEFFFSVSDEVGNSTYLSRTVTAK